jgi:8-oxo-dGTP pyrophosphatase MutT (NUDIX family)
VTGAEARARLEAAVRAEGAPSSDYDLNAHVALPEGRVLRPAAVLVAALEGRSGAEMLLTERASTLKHHPGQVAFPGGKHDLDDPSLVATALREAHEEVGLPPDAVEVLGLLPPHETVTGFLVTPVLAWVPAAFRPVAEPGEVAEVFTVPLAHLADPARYVVRSRRWRGQERRFFAVPYGPHYIWGATARMLRALADRMPR